MSGTDDVGVHGSGTYTFLFTDIEGSTELLRATGVAYEDLLEEHRRILRTVFTAHGGHEVDTRGDAFFVAFASPVHAVTAAAEAQRALTAYCGPQDRRVCVRMGVHTGEARVSADGYVGLSVHEAARIAAVAHGGQVVLSDATAALVRDDLGAGLSLRSLGRHSLKDFAGPVGLYQLDVEGLEGDFPPLRTPVQHRGADAYRRRRWAEAYELLSAEDAESPLPPEELDLLVTTAYLTGREDVGDELSARAFAEWSRRGEVPRAARSAVRLGMQLLLRGEGARGGGWLTRARRLLDDAGVDCAERGYLLAPRGLEQMARGDPAGALEQFDRVREIGERFRDPDVTALGRVGASHALIRLRRGGEALAYLDEVMVAATAGELSPVETGIVQCAAIEACEEIYDVRRVREWTSALTHWCAAQPDLVPFRGQCLVHRAHVMQLGGRWPDALTEARGACRRLADRPAAGAAFYQLAELHRLRGEFPEAERAYQQASRWMPEPLPGLALLRLAQGQVTSAAAAIRHALEEFTDAVERSRLLGAQAEVMVAAGDVAAARAAADELGDLAEQFGGPWLHALAATAQGTALVADRDWPDALAVLRRARASWQEIEAPYEAARVRVLIGEALHGLGRPEIAEMELDAARAVFEELGAAPDVARVDALSRAREADAGSLTRRELEVLRLMGNGMTDQQIAAELHLSGRTVGRHVGHVLAKLHVPTREAAAAYAQQHAV